MLDIRTPQQTYETGYRLPRYFSRGHPGQHTREKKQTTRRQFCGLLCLITYHRYFYQRK